MAMPVIHFSINAVRASPTSGAAALKGLLGYISGVKSFGGVKVHAPHDLSEVQLFDVLAGQTSTATELVERLNLAEMRKDGSGYQMRGGRRKPKFRNDGSIVPPKKSQGPNLARHIDCALPYGAPPSARLEIARRFAHHLRDAYKCAVFFAVHNKAVASANDAHFVISDREVDSDGQVGRKIRALNNFESKAKARAEAPDDTEIAGSCETLRSIFTGICNEILATHGAAPITHKSYERQGLQIVPQKKRNRAAEMRTARIAAREIAGGRAANAWPALQARSMRANRQKRVAAEEARLLAQSQGPASAPIVESTQLAMGPQRNQSESVDQPNWRGIPSPEAPRKIVVPAARVPLSQKSARQPPHSSDARPVAHSPTISTDRERLAGSSPQIVTPPPAARADHREQNVIDAPVRRAAKRQTPILDESKAQAKQDVAEAYSGPAEDAPVVSKVDEVIPDSKHAIGATDNPPPEIEPADRPKAPSNEKSDDTSCALVTFGAEPTIGEDLNYPTFDDDEILDFYNAGPEIEIDECDDSKVAVRKLTGQSETLHPILQSDSGRSEPQMDPRGREDLDDVVFDDDDIVDWFNSEPGAAIDERQVNDTATITTSHSEAAGAQFGLQDHGDVAQAKRREQRVAGDHVNQGDGNAAEPESAWHPSLLSDIDRRLLRVLRITDGMLLEWYFALRQALGDTYEKMKAWWASADAAARDEALNCEWPTVAQLKADLEAKGFRSRHLPNTLYTTKGPRTK